MHSATSISPAKSSLWKSKLCNSVIVQAPFLWMINLLVTFQILNWLFTPSSSFFKLSSAVSFVSQSLRSGWHAYLYCSIYTVRIPRWSPRKESTRPCRRIKRCEFDHWVTKIPSNRKWHPTPVFLPGKFHAQRSLTGYSPWGHRVGHDWAQITEWCKWWYPLTDTSVSQDIFNFNLTHPFKALY